MSFLNKISKNKISVFFILAVAGFVLSTPAYALSCGDTVSGTVTLTANLACAGPGLIVGASNTLIDLNGFTISCSGAGGGYLGSCQNSISTPPPLPPAVVGIRSTGHNNVLVRGPGTITGFGVGVRMVSGSGLHVTGVTITGPPETLSIDLHSRRLLTVGVLIGNTTCGVLTVSSAATVEFNDISNQTMGVQLSIASCVLVTGNNIHDNEGATGDAHGIDVIESANNVITTNLVTRNGVNTGANGGVDGGIMLRSAQSLGNLVFFNYVTSNCGDGITADNAAHNNTIASNVALNNSTSTLNGRCVAVPAGVFFDVATRNQATGNLWNANNTCKTQSAGIPNGVCP